MERKERRRSRDKKKEGERKRREEEEMRGEGKGKEENKERRTILQLVIDTHLYTMYTNRMGPVSPTLDQKVAFRLLLDQKVVAILPTLDQSGISPTLKKMLYLASTQHQLVCL